MLAVGKGCNLISALLLQTEESAGLNGIH